MTEAVENQEVVESEVVADQETTEVETQEAEAEDYSWVPKKFIKDGEPDLQGLAKSYQALEKRLGSRSLASDSLEDYVFESKAGLSLDPEVSDSFKAEAQEKGLSPEQYAWVMEKYEAAVTQSSITPDKAEEVLRQQWGKSFDTNLKNARAAWDAFAPSDLSIDEVGNNPAVLKILAMVGAELGEDKPTAKGSTRPALLSQEEIDAIIRSPDYSGDLKKQAVVRDWYEKKYGA